MATAVMNTASGIVYVRSISGTLTISSTGSLAFGTDLFLTRDGANTLAQRNGTSAQIFRVYNTYANGGTDYERAQMQWSGNVFFMGTSAGGTGTLRELQVAGSTITFTKPGVANRWQIDTNGHFMAFTDNTYDIGASGATRPRTIYVGTNVVVGAAVTTGTVFAGGSSRSQLFLNETDGLARFANNAGTGFTRLILGTNDTSGIAFKKNSTALEIKLGDDSSFTELRAGAISSGAGASTPAGGSAGAAVYIGTAAVGFYIGTGAPTVSAAKGSIYSRTDATTTTTRLYINTDGATTWTNFTTAA